MREICIGKVGAEIVQDTRLRGGLTIGYVSLIQVCDDFVMMKSKSQFIWWDWERGTGNVKDKSKVIWWDREYEEQV